MEWLSFLLSLVPLMELRFSIPFAIWYNPSLPLPTVLVVCVALNILAIPIAYLLLDFILPPIRQRSNLVERLFKWAVKRAQKHQNLSLVGLAVFVGVPLPATGAYTGALIAYIAGLDRKRAALAIAAGVVIAGALMWILITLGIVLVQGIW